MAYTCKRKPIFFLSFKKSELKKIFFLEKLNLILQVTEVRKQHLHTQGSQSTSGGNA